MSHRRVLITGAGGQLGSDLAAKLSDEAEVLALGHGQLDIADDHALGKAFDQASPELVLNCAAFHNVGVCEREEDRAFAVNARAVKRLAERCAAAEALLVHLSTNYVFDGTASEPYTEVDTPNPRSVYAISKLAGEYAALTYAPRALVVRTAGLYGEHGSASKGGNFVTRMVAKAREQGQITMVSDQRLTPTYTRDLAAALLDATDRGVTGLTHLTNAGSCSWYEFTEQILGLAGLDAPLTAVQTTSQPGQPDRPINGVLANHAAAAAGLKPLRPWPEALADYMDRAGLVAQPTS